MKFLSGLCAATLVCACVVSGCSHEPADKFVAKPPETIPPATVTPGNETALFPLDKGNQWTYSVSVLTRTNGQDGQTQNYDSVWTVTSSKTSGDGVEATIETSSPATSKKDVQIWRANSKGIYEVADGDPLVNFTPPFPVITFPVKEGTVYNWQGTGPNGMKGGGPQKSVRTIRASQVVDTDMGRMSAIPVDDSGTLMTNGKQGQSASTIWFAPGVGIVRLRQEVVVGNSGYVLLIKLKSKSLMKS